MFKFFGKTIRKKELNSSGEGSHGVHLGTHRQNSGSAPGSKNASADNSLDLYAEDEKNLKRNKLISSSPSSSSPRFPVRDLAGESTESSDDEKKKEKKGKKKKGSSNDDDEPEVPETKTTVHANCFEELPDDLKKKIRKSKVDVDQIDKHFDVLCNVLRFTTKRQIIRDADSEPRSSSDKPEVKHDSSESNLPAWMLKDAEGLISYTNPKKFYKKAEFRGKGGFGRVYYAKTNNGKVVAIKKMPSRTPKEKRMNYDEIAVLNFCNHPNIVQYQRAFMFEDEASVVMEFMEGGSLSEAVKKFSFSEAHIAFVAREMLKGIKYLHSNGLVHRDLKSGNVMLTTKGEVKLIDFGLTVDISRCRVHMVGSPFWMPPEMIQCKAHGFAADIWSFAICLLEMADRKPPNRKARIKAMFITATEGLQPYVKEQSYSNDFKDLLLKCLELDPEKRWTPDQLLQHPFIVNATSQKVMEDILRQIFLSRAFENSGMFL